MQHPGSFTDYAERLYAFMEASALVEGATPASTTRPSPSFEELATQLFSLQIAHNPSYAAFCRGRLKGGQVPETWRQIPAMPTAGFKELELSCLPTAQRTHVFHSSGTTQDRPSRHFHSTESLQIYERSLLAWSQPHLAPDSRARATEPRPLILNLTPTAEAVPQSSLVHMLKVLAWHFAPESEHFLGQVDPQGGWSLNVESFLTPVQRNASPTRPVWVLGTAFNFVHLLDNLEALRTRVDLPPGSRVMETGGYKGRSRRLEKEALHTWISEKLGVSRDHILCEYGMSELSSQAYDSVIPCPGTKAASSSRRFRFPPWARALILSPETGLEVGDGEIGLIRIVDLANAFSVMAVQTEDLGRRRGDGFELLGRAEQAEPRGCSLQSTELAQSSQSPGSPPQADHPNSNLR